MLEKKDLSTTSFNIPFGLSLRANFSWTFIGNVVYAGSQWGMLVVLTKLGTSEMVGQFALGLAITAPVIIFSNLALRQVQTVDARNEYLFGDYLGLRLITTALALLLIVGIVLTTGYRLETRLVVLVVGLAKTFEAISDIFYGLFQKYERLDCIAKSMMIKGPLSLVVLSIGVYLTNGVLWGVIGLASVWALVLFTYDVRAGTVVQKTGLRVSETKAVVSPHSISYLRPHWEVRALGKLVGLTLPLGLAMMLISLNVNIPRYFIDYYWGEGEVGIFAAIAYLQTVGAIVVTALGQSASPRLSKYYASRKGPAFRMLLTKLIAIGVLLGGAGMLVSLVAGREILTFFYTVEYAERVNILLWLMLAAGIGYVGSFLSYSMTASHFFKAQPLIFLVSAALTALLCALLIPRHGILGAAWTTVIVSLVQTTIVFAYTLLVIDLVKLPVKHRSPGSDLMFEFKNVFRKLLRLLMANNLARSITRSVAHIGFLPEAIWKRLPVEGTFYVSLPDGTRFSYLAVDDDIGRSLFWRNLKGYEAETVQVFYRLAQKSSLVLDIGANTGLYTLVACAANSSSRVISFEPNPDVCARLIANIEINGWEERCEVRGEAVSNTVGITKLHVPQGRSIPKSSSLHVQGFRDYPGSLIDVPMTTVDAIYSGVQRVDLAKIDVEGFEDKVLEGMQQVIADSSPSMILECNIDGPFVAVESLLKQFDYCFFHLCREGPIAVDTIVPDENNKYWNFLCTVHDDCVG